MAGEALTDDLRTLEQIIERDPELERALNIIIRLWNIPGTRSQKEIDIAWKKLFTRLQHVDEINIERAGVKKYEYHPISAKDLLKNCLRNVWNLNF